MSMKSFLKINKYKDKYRDKTLFGKEDFGVKKKILTVLGIIVAAIVLFYLYLFLTA